MRYLIPFDRCLVVIADTEEIAIITNNENFNYTKTGLKLFGDNDLG